MVWIGTARKPAKRGKAFGMHQHLKPLLAGKPIPLTKPSAMPIRLPLFFLLVLMWSSCLDRSSSPANRKQADGVEQRFSGAEWSLLQWSAFRAYPGERVPAKSWECARQDLQSRLQSRSLPDADWQAIGPKNIGGRTLCLAFHPQNPDIIYAGSAGGGLWKSHTAGQGVQAWEPVETGYPLIGVPAIAINPLNPDEMYIGTGEVYNYEAASPGVINRITRGTYGIGILKTTDGGQTWTKSLDWNLEEMTGVQDLLINPLRPETVFAATTKGLYRSYDAGATWEKIFYPDMAIDIEMHPADTGRLYVSFGNFNSPVSGVFRSLDGGQTFELLENGLPADYTGKTLLAISPSNPSVVYASVADDFSGKGLYRSVDGGDSWTQMTDLNYATYQGWYSHDVAVKPDNPDHLVFAGVNTFLSTDGGLTFSQVGDWSAWYFGQVPVGGPEGPSNYVHADVHALYFRPDNPNEVFAATDGGIFYSGDAGLSWEGRNGYYQTQQFYANFGNSMLSADLAIGGMQDNATAIYTGEDAWTRVVGGDGMSAAIDPTDDDIMYASAQFLYLLRADDGENFNSFIRPPEADQELRAFSGAFELAPQLPGALYAGSSRLYYSTDRGENWEATGAGHVVDDQTPIFRIGLSLLDPNLILLSLVNYYDLSAAYVRRSTDGGVTWQPVSGLPDRIAMDFALSHADPDVAFVVFSGFGTPHVYKTEDGGATWFPSDSGLPDVPANSVLFDPFDAEILYVGNDLGVFASTDGGANWEPYMDGLPTGVLAMDVTASLPAMKLRIATHGHGIYEGNLLSQSVATSNLPKQTAFFQSFPNPSNGRFSLQWQGSEAFQGTWEVRDTRAGIVRARSPLRLSPNETLDVELDLPSGMYYARFYDEQGRQSVLQLVLER